MNLEEVIELRKSYRVLDPVDIDQKTIDHLVHTASLAPSCYNNQPWRYLFVTDKGLLKKMVEDALPDGNNWAAESSMIVVVFTKKDLDCVIHEREYALYDCGISAGFMMLAATEMGLVAHPIAGYSPKKIRKLTGIPEEMNVINLIVFGRIAKKDGSERDEKIEEEQQRTPRKSPDEFVWYDRYEERDD